MVELTKDGQKERNHLRKKQRQKVGRRNETIFNRVAAGEDITELVGRYKLPPEKIEHIFFKLHRKKERRARWEAKRGQA
jgi:Mor family transcriptional regulator